MFKKEIYSLLLFSFGLLFTCCGESATDDEEKDNNGQGSVSVETNYLPIADPYVMFYNNNILCLWYRRNNCRRGVCLLFLLTI